MYRTAEKMEEPEHDAYVQERKRIHCEMALDDPRMREKSVAADSSGGGVMLSVIVPGMVRTSMPKMRRQSSRHRSMTS